MVSPGCASGSFQAGQGQYVGDEGGVKAAQLGVAIDAARIANMKIRRIGFPQSRRAGPARSAFGVVGPKSPRTLLPGSLACVKASTVRRGIKRSGVVTAAEI